MKKTVLFLSITFLCTTKSFSQENQINLKKFGVGISHAFNFMEVYNFEYPMDLNKIVFPININNRIRVEPEISGAYNSFFDEFWVSVGSAVYFQKQHEKINILYGVNSGVSMSDWSFTLNAAPTVGLEYFLSSQFSFGAEIQLKAGFSLDSDDSGINLALMAPITARFYLK